jgi:hypothetical protein
MVDSNITKDVYYKLEHDKKIAANLAKQFAFFTTILHSKIYYNIWRHIHILTIDEYIDAILHTHLACT